jgi:hypothetical protein
MVISAADVKDCQDRAELDSHGAATLERGDQNPPENDSEESDSDF